MEDPVLAAQTEVSRPSSSLGGRLANVIAAPGQVFEEIKASPPATSNWLVPALLLGLMGIIYAWVVFSQPNVLQQIREQQEKVMRKQLANMPAEQREQAIEMAEKFSGPTMLKVTGSLSAVLGGFAQVLFFALLLWALGKLVLHDDFTYLKAMEVAGLASIVRVLGTLISMLLAIITANANAGLSPALLFREFDRTNVLHLLLANLNVITLWYLALLALGLAKLSGRSILKPALWIYGIWAAIKGSLVLFSWGMQQVVQQFQNQA